MIRLSPAPTAGALCGGRDNNLNLIRMIAAAAVLVSHAHPIALGVGAAEPLRAATGFSLGGIAVLVFFSISGFLIARSWDRAPRRADWVAARVMRLIPGLLAATLLTAFVMGAAVTALPAAEYLTRPDTLLYALRNTTLVSMQHHLPGVFETNPYPRAVNGSLWTLFHEALCYGGVAALGLAGALRRPRLMAAALGLFALYYAGMAALEARGAVHGGALTRLENLRPLALAFILGTALYVWRDRVPMRWSLGAGLAALCALLWSTPLQPVLFTLALGYGVFLAAWLPGGPLRAYNRLGDYSYGVYVYAWPVQQCMVLAFGPMSPLENILLSLPATLLLAVLSWRLVEGPALGARHRLADLLARGRNAPEPRP